MPNPVKPITSLYRESNFGSAFTGLAGISLGYRLLDDTGGTVVARTIVGVFELVAGSGSYGVIVPTVAVTASTIMWDTGGGSPVFASEDIQNDMHIENNRKRLWNRDETDPGTGVNTQYDDDDITPLATADIFEDVTGITPYNNAGINRRNRLT